MPLREAVQMARRFLRRGEPEVCLVIPRQATADQRARESQESAGGCAAGAVCRVLQTKQFFSGHKWRLEKNKSLFFLTQQKTKLRLACGLEKDVLESEKREAVAESLLEADFKLA